MPRQLGPARRALIEAAWRGQAETTQRTPYSPLYLSTGGQPVRLSNARGELTAAGRYYVSLGDIGDRPVRRPLDLSKEPRKVGNGYQIEVDGKWRWIRRGSAVTKLGQEYYAAKAPTKYIVMVPGLQRGRLSNSKGVERDVPSTAFMGGEIELPAGTDPGDVERLLRDLVTAAIAELPSDARGTILLEDSEPIYYRPEGQWTFSQQTYVNQDGPPTFSSIVNRPLLGCHIAPPSVLAAYGLAPSALRDTQGRCVPTQLHEITGQPLLEVEEALDEAFERLEGEAKEAYEDEGWRERGCTPSLVLEYAKVTRRPCYILHCGRLLQKFTPADRDHHAAALCFSVAGDHAFFVADEAARRGLCKLREGRKEPPPVARLVTSRCDDLERLTADLQWWSFDAEPEPDTEYFTHIDLDVLQGILERDGRTILGRRRGTKRKGPALKLPDGITIAEADSKLWRDAIPWEGLENVKRRRRHYTDDIEAVRQELHDQGVVPKVKMASSTRIKSLVLPDEGSTEILQSPALATELGRWALELQKLGVPLEYGGQSGPAFAHAVAVRLARSVRGAVPGAWRQEAVAPGLCQGCGAAFDEQFPAEIDHRAPLRAGGAHAPENLQALCRFCHLRKTLDESRGPGENNVLASVFAPGVYEAFHASEKPPQIVTMRAAPAKGLSVLQLDVKACRRNALEHNAFPLPVFSPLDEPKPAVPGDASADYYWVEKPVEWSDKSFWDHVGLYCGPRWVWKGLLFEALEAKALTWDHVKLSLTATSHLPPAFLPHIFGRMEEAWRAANPEVPFKRLVLPMLGLWNAPAQAYYTCETCVDDHDAALCGPVARRSLQVAGESGVFHDLIWKTDLLTYASMRPIGQICLDVEHARVSRLVRLARPFLCRNPRQRYEILGAVVDCIYVQAPARELRDLCRAVDAERHQDGTPVYHHKKEAPPNYPPADGQWPTVSQERPALGSDPWREYLEVPGAVEALALLEEVVLERKESCFLAGLAGTGKSHAAKIVVKKLREAGESVAVLAFTNQAARNHSAVQGETIHHFLHRAPSFKGWLFVDEASQLPLSLFASLMKYRLAGCKFCFIGDFVGQFPAAYDTWRRDAVPELALEHSAALKQLCDGNRVTFTQCRRSDPELYAIYSALPGLEPQEALERLRGLFPLTPALPDWELCVSHKQRIELCLARNRLDAEACEWPKEEVFLPKDRVKVTLYKGVRLMGVKTEGGIYNGGLYRLAKFAGRDYHLEDLDGGGVVKLPRTSLDRVVLASALVYYSVQGRTLPGRVRLYTRGSRMSVRTLTVGVSRATRKELVEVE